MTETIVSQTTTDYYKSHWVEIEAERFDRYLEMFKWSDDAMRYYEPARIRSGERVVEIGCGPGYTACEIAKWVGSAGRVHGVDVNAGFLDHARGLARERSLHDRVDFVRVNDSTLPFENASIDCVVAKNVFLYVDSPQDSFAECRRVLKKGGRIHVVEGDWGLLFAEPVPTSDWQDFIDAASVAFRTPRIGRQLYGLARRAGFEEVTVSTVTNLDTTGRLLPMVRNLCAYARQGGGLEEDRIVSVLKTCEAAAAADELLICSPQFVVTAWC